MYKLLLNIINKTDDNVVHKNGNETIIDTKKFMDTIITKNLSSIDSIIDNDELINNNLIVSNNALVGNDLTVNQDTLIKNNLTVDNLLIIKSGIILNNNNLSTIIDTKAPLNSPSFTGIPTCPDIIDNNMEQIVNRKFVENKISDVIGQAPEVLNAQQTALTAQQADLSLKAPLLNPTFTGTVNGITSAMVGLGNVDNTSDANKPISMAQQTALDLKASLANPTFTGTVNGINKTMVCLLYTSPSPRD